MLICPQQSKGTVPGTKIGRKVTVAVDPDKFDNIDLNGTTSFQTEETVTIAKRDLSTAGTKISVKTLSGQIPTNIQVSELASKYLVFTGVKVQIFLQSEMQKMNIQLS